MYIHLSALVLWCGSLVPVSNIVIFVAVLKWRLSSENVLQHEMAMLALHQSQQHLLWCCGADVKLWLLLMQCWSAAMFIVVLWCPRPTVSAVVFSGCPWLTSLLWRAHYIRKKKPQTTVLGNLPQPKWVVIPGLSFILLRSLEWHIIFCTTQNGLSLN